MIYISHRGNLEGPVPEKENTPGFIQAALDQGFEVEIDVWRVNSSWFLGHNGPQFEVGQNFLSQAGLWCHCKNYEALFQLKNLNIHCFFHHDDDFTFTSKGIIWGHVNALPPAGGIHVLPEISGKDFSACLGICSDFVARYKQEKLP